MSNKDAGDIADAIAGALNEESRSPKQCKENPDGEQGKLVMFSAVSISLIIFIFSISPLLYKVMQPATNYILWYHI